jgi:hypothetical protein
LDQLILLPGKQVQMSGENCTNFGKIWFSKLEGFQSIICPEPWVRGNGEISADDVTAATCNNK